MPSYRKVNLNEDLSAVVDLLSRNLDSRISENFFKRKHFENPFGPSTGIVALENSKIIGVKMLMKWEFRQNETVVKALRPVDTAVEQSYQGKGIFREMSKILKEDFNEYVDFVFNTPNANSIIPNLKAGWSSINYKHHFYLGIVMPKLHEVEVNEVLKTKVVLDRYTNRTDFYITNISKTFLIWRYRDSDYRCFEIKSSNDKAYVYFKIKKMKGLNLLVICEMTGNSKHFSRYISAVCSRLKIFIVYYLENPFLKDLDFLLKIKRKAANVLYNEIGENKLKSNLIFSLGDLEGKL